MRRLPVLPTLVVAAAVVVMIGLGIWQLQRAAWKERLVSIKADKPKDDKPKDDDHGGEEGLEMPQMPME